MRFSVIFGRAIKSEYLVLGTLAVAGCTYLHHCRPSQKLHCDTDHICLDGAMSLAGKSPSTADRAKALAGEIKADSK